jgi:hypothetical protein
MLVVVTIIAICLLIPLLSISVLINIRLIKEYSLLTDFFAKMEEEVHDNYMFFDKMCKTNLLMNDPYVVDLIDRLKNTRLQFESYLETIRKNNGSKFASSDKEEETSEKA